MHPPWQLLDRSSGDADWRWHTASLRRGCARLFPQTRRPAYIFDGNVTQSVICRLNRFRREGPRERNFSERVGGGVAHRKPLSSALTASLIREPVAYGDVVAMTAGFIHLVYYYYHIENTTFGGDHENDLEGVLVSINRRNGDVVLLRSLYHNRWQVRSWTKKLRGIDRRRYQLLIAGNGHAIYLLLDPPQNENGFRRAGRYLLSQVRPRLPLSCFATSTSRFPWWRARSTSRACRGSCS